MRSLELETFKERGALAAARRVRYGLAVAVMAFVGGIMFAGESLHAQQPAPQAFPGVHPGPRIPPAFQTRVIPAAVPAEDPSARLPDPVPATSPAEPGGRRASRLLRDGDLRSPQRSRQPIDGVLAQQVYRPPVDGDLKQIATARSIDPGREAAFAYGDGFDIFTRRPEIDPIQDRRPARFFRFGPFEAVGVKIGNFVLFPELELGGGATSNVLSTATATRSDTFLMVRPTIDLLSNWRRHAMEFRATGLGSFHDRVSSEDDREALVELRGRVDVGKRTNISGQVSYQLQQESSSSINARGGIADRADIVTRRASASFQHRFNRLTLQLRGSVSTFDYGPVAVGAGAVLGQNDRDYIARDAAVRASYEFKPNLIVFGEVQGDRRRYDVPALSDGILRSSTGWRYRLGVSAGNSGATLRGDLSIGFAMQSPDDQRLQDISGLIIDANLAWRLSGLTSLLLTAGSQIGETTLAGSPGSLTRSAGLEVRHAIRRNFIASAGLQLAVTEYESTPIKEQDWLARVGLDYYINRSLKLWTRIEHTMFRSTQAGRDYDETEGRVGLTIRR